MKNAWKKAFKYDSVKTKTNNDITSINLLIIPSLGWVKGCACDGLCVFEQAKHCGSAYITQCMFLQDRCSCKSNCQSFHFLDFAGFSICKTASPSTWPPAAAQEAQLRSIMGFYILCQRGSYYSLFANDSMLFISFTHKHRRKSRLAGIHGKRLISNLLKSCLLLCIDS